jgi:hypothetical protein
MHRDYPSLSPHQASFSFSRPSDEANKTKSKKIKAAITWQFPDKKYRRKLIFADIFSGSRHI